MEPSSLLKAVLSSGSFSNERSRRRVEAILRLYQYIGLLAFLGGGLYFVSRRLGIRIEPEDQPAVTIAAVGLLIALVSRLWLSLYVEKERLMSETYSLVGSEQHFLSEWREFERLAAKALDKPQQDRPVSPRLLISGLFEKGYLNPTEVSALQDAMIVRNSIVHGSEQEMEPDAVARAYASISPILSRIESVLGN